MDGGEIEVGNGTLQRQCPQGRSVSDEQQADILVSLNFDF